MRLESWSADGFSTTGAKPIRRISQLIVSLLLLVFTLIAVPAVRAVDGITTPPDGGGMQWSKMERALDRNNNQLKWKPYGNDRAAPAKFRDVEFVGYKVPLDNGDEVLVWFLPGDRPAGFTEQEWNDLKAWCHGRTFDDTILSPGGESVPKIVAAGWKLKACFRQNRQLNLANGDLMVYYQIPIVRRPATVMHTAKYNGDNTFTSKNRYETTIPKATLAQMNALYRAGTFGQACYELK